MRELLKKEIIDSEGRLREDINMLISDIEERLNKKIFQVDIALGRKMISRIFKAKGFAENWNKREINKLKSRIDRLGKNSMVQDEKSKYRKRNWPKNLSAKN